MKRLCTICARGGSKGVKNKNIRPLLGHPLIAFSIKQAKASGMFECVAVSSDSSEILEAARKYGADILIERPSEMATDESAKLPAIQHCVTTVEQQMKTTFDIVVDMDATSPLRYVEDIQEAIRILEEQDGANLITGAPARRSPYFNLVELDSNNIVRLSKPLERQVVRRQDSPKCFDMNASIYVWKREEFFAQKTLFNEKTLLYVMPEDRSIDIDSEIDFKFVEFLMSEKREKYETLFV
ncbi:MULTISPECIES: acylneuraminate cytidylyltransferase family protein [Brevibacillus]|uniref:acylneuraminate cytidylyltransferase family protein n=1 Tax=Brevibacillus TaxID=55080 RepID=UPI0024769C8B|nr:MULTISPECIES: acylneuraminate cytidylyltransferase family protein [Brevibacillus]MDR4997937.1 acylneuraminate cytidylyltransferase family protein [Brevibacillus parabrevis]